MQHGVGLGIKEETVKKAAKDGITIECISARLLKARISIKSNFVTFVVAYASTEKAPEGQKAKNMAALNCTVASVPAREHVFVLTEGNARTGKRGEGGGEADSKVLSANDQDMLDENGKLLLGSRRRQQARSSEHFLLHPQKWCVPYVPKRQPQQGTTTFGLYPDKAGGPPTHPLR